MSPVQDTPTLEALCHGWFWHSPLGDQNHCPHSLPGCSVSLLQLWEQSGQMTLLPWTQCSGLTFLQTPTLGSRHLQTTLASLALKLEEKSFYLQGHTWQISCCCTPWASSGFPRQEYWSRLLFLSPVLSSRPRG